MKVDIGEQDLELYVELAKERPEQILAVLLRDVVPQVTPTGDHLLSDQMIEEPENMGPLSKPIPARPLASMSVPLAVGSSKQPLSYVPYVPRSRSGTEPRRPLQQQPQPIPVMQARQSFVDDDPTMPGRDLWTQGNGNGDQVKMSPAERKRWELDQRIARAKETLPSHITFRVFCHPDEIEEVYAIVDSLSTARS